MGKLMARVGVNLPGSEVVRAGPEVTRGGSECNKSDFLPIRLSRLRT